MNFAIKANCQHGELVHRRKTPEAALKEARELSRIGCYNVHIVTPEGRDYASSEFGDIPRSPSACAPFGAHKLAPPALPRKRNEALNPAGRIMISGPEL
jgi:hypothetical protein